MKSRFWPVLSLLAFVAGLLFWMEGNRRRDAARPPAPTNALQTTQKVAQLTAPPRSNITLLTRLDNLRAASAAGAAAPVKHTDPAFPQRLRNTDRSLSALSRSDTAILLQNALIDTASRDPLDVPAALRATGEPGAYVVQARGPVTEKFRANIEASGGRIVSYIPNNAYLVRISGQGAAQLASTAQAVLPFEPYYKLAPGLLKQVLDAQPLPAEARLTVTAFAEDRDTVRAALRDLHAAVLNEARSPFGPQFVVAPGGTDLAALASLRGVQLVEPYTARVVMSDLTRERLAISADTVVSNNYLGLTGSNVWVNVNDSGVDAQNPDLTGRVFGTNSLDPILTDPTGHGTHVAGVIASSGEHGPTGTNVPPGSVTNANFRGMAPEAKLFALGVDLVSGPLVSDTALQTIAAQTNYLTLGRTNALISNNSWGYNRAYEYDSAAASYDAAVRDALPDETGSQPLLYVFSAGNEGFGNDSGSGGVPGSIHSPATAKNVLTIGATEQIRPITETVVVTNQVTNIVNGEFEVTNVVETNDVVLTYADSDDEVAPFSSRGNVGIGIEGDQGRFKPDLVAPGVFVVSTRSTDWSVDLTTTNTTVYTYAQQLVLPDEWNRYSLLVPTNTVRLTITTLPAPDSPQPFPDLQIYAKFGADPTTADFQAVTNAVIASPQEGEWFYAIANPTQSRVTFTLRVRLEVKNANEDLLALLKQIDDPFRTNDIPYRYDTGTSASAAAVSGLLALMQEFFEQQLKQSYSPALMKALLINGARSLGPQYNLQVRTLLNYQGWGLPALTNIFPASLTNHLDQPDLWPVHWVDQNPTNAVATGETRAYDIEVPTNALNSDLRVTLVWTDPPGNPAASIKLVNDLDLVVSNKTTGEMFLGNDIPASSDYNPATSTNATEQLFDNINNVENVFLRGPIDTNYTVFVTGRRVNVNAVTAHTNDIVQDYALVVSVGGTTNALKFTPLPLLATNVAEATIMTNGVPLLYQHAGANSPLVGGPDGTTNQWHFYVFTNEFNPALAGGDTNFGPYVAFLTFVPPNLSVPRTGEEADIDLYVSRGDSNLLALDPAAVAAAYKSLDRGGTELVAFTNATEGEVFYVGVKSEDQMSAEYGIIGLSSTEPFGNLLPDGSYLMQGRPVPLAIPDGTPSSPQAALVFGVGIYPMTVGRTIVYSTVTHEETGDLVGNLSHKGNFAVLNNHTPIPASSNGVLSAIYDDMDSSIEPAALRTDGPGSLVDFIGGKGDGVWQLTMVDNALGHTGSVDNLQVRIFPAPDLLAGTFVTLLPNQYSIFFVDVPVDASLLRILLSQMTLPVDVFVRYDLPPSLTEYDKTARIPPPSGELTVGPTDIPPLQPGRYFVGVFNPNAVSTSFYIRAVIERSDTGRLISDLVSSNTVPLRDDARMYITNYVGEARTVADVKVGIRVSHPRVSDLAFSLVSPQGTHTLLAENRGRTNRTEYGYDQISTNFHHVAVTYSTNTGLAILYLDGQQQAQRNLGSFAPDTRNSLYLGRQPATNQLAAQYLGQMDEVDLYARELAPSELLGIYQFGGAGKPTNALVSRWSFDGDGADTQTNNPASVDGPTFVPGKFGLALDFAAEGDLVQVTNRNGLDVGLSNGLTVDAWINPADLTSNRTLAAWSDGTNRLGVEFGIKPGTSTNAPFGLLFVNLRDRSGSNHVLEASTQGLIQTNAILTNTVFVTFTDDTNLTAIPIKFAEPDTAPSGRSTNQLVSGFENVVSQRVTVLHAGDVFDGWTVGQDAPRPPAILNAPDVAHTGTNLLVLRDGVLATNVTTLPGKMYRLQWTHRRETLPDGIVSWWPAERSTEDVIGTNDGVAMVGLGYLPGKVGQSFGLTNAGYMRVPDSPSLTFTNQFSIEFWFLPVSYGPFGSSLLYKSDPNNPQRQNYFVSVSTVALDAGFNDPTQAGAGSDLQGGLEGVRLSPPPSVGEFHHVVATYRQLNAAQVEMAIYLDGEKQRIKVIAGVLANATNNGAFYVGRSSFQGRLDELTLYNRVLTDNEVAELYRADALGKAPPPVLPQTRVLVNGGASTVFTSDPWWATNGLTFLATATNTPVEVSSLQPGAMLDSFGLLELPATQFLPEEPLKPFIGENALGDWKLEVVDRRVGATNDLDQAFIQWQLQLTYAPITVPAVALTNGVPYTNTIPSGQARYFIVDVPLDATHATNTLLATTGLDLWYNQLGLPTYGGSGEDYLLLTNTTGNLAVILTNGTQVLDTNRVLQAATGAPQLVPGQRYYLAITNTQAATDYSIQVDFNQLNGAVTGVTDLAPGQTILTNIAVTNALQYYRYNVSTNAVAASFEVYPTNGNVQLYLRKAEPVRNPLPTPQQYDYASENPGTNTEFILVTQNSLPVPLSSGAWYLGVLNADTVPVTYRIRVLEFTNFVDKIIDLKEGVTSFQAVQPGELSRLYFRFIVFNSDPAVQFDLTELNGRAELLAQLGSKPTHQSYQYLDEGAPGLPAKLVIRPVGDLTSLNGEWYLAVYNLETGPISFGMTASFPPAGPNLRGLSNDVPVTNTIAADTLGLPQVLDYYQFTVPDGATNVTFQVTPFNGNVDLVLRKGDLPDAYTFDYVSANPDVVPEIITVDPTTFPVPLAPGDWFLGVVNNSLLSTTYAVRVTSLPAGVGGPLRINPVVTVVNGVATFTWQAAPGLRFQVQYATEIPPDGVIVWTAVPGEVTSLTGDYSFTDDGSLTGGLTAFKIYRVVQLPAGAGGGLSINPVVSEANGVATFTWQATPGQRFQVQYATEIPADGVIAWTAVPGVVTSPTGDYSFADDGSLTGGRTAFKIYRIVQLP